MRSQIAPRRHDPRAVEQSGADGVADREADLARIPRRADCGKACRGDFLREKHAAQGAELERAVQVDVLLTLGVAISEMSVNIDQSGHHKAAGIIEYPVVADAPRRHFLR